MLSCDRQMYALTNFLTSIVIVGHCMPYRVAYSVHMLKYNQSQSTQKTQHPSSRLSVCQALDLYKPVKLEVHQLFGAFKGIPNFASSTNDITNSSISENENII